MDYRKKAVQEVAALGYPDNEWVIARIERALREAAAEAVMEFGQRVTGSRSYLAQASDEADRIRRGEG